MHDTIIDNILLNEPREADYHNALAVVIGTLDMTIQDKSGNYLAGPISTGRRHYDLLHKFRVDNTKDLITKIGLEAYQKSVRLPNTEESQQYFKQLSIKGIYPIINTATLHIPFWKNDWYMYICFHIIQKRVIRLFFREGWAFSSGSLKEYKICYEAGYELRSVEGNILSRSVARTEIENARIIIRNYGLPTFRHDRYLDEF